MGNSRRRRDQRRRQRQRHRATEAVRSHDIVKAVIECLPEELHAEIHRRLPFVRRLAFASVCSASGHMLRPEAPWLILPGETEEEEQTKEIEHKATILSMAEGEALASVRTMDLALHDRVVIGSGGGWLVTADDQAVLRVANPATGVQADLPAISTIPFLHRRGGSWVWFCLDVEPFLQIRFGGLPQPEHKEWWPSPPRSSTLTAAQMRQKFYRKVVLSTRPRPASYAAMLLTDRHIGAPAFATAEDPVWRMAQSPDGVEDAIHLDGRFYSITYTGHVEAWDRDVDTGEFTSQPVAPPPPWLAACEDKDLRRKYLAASTDGRLMVVLKHTPYRNKAMSCVAFEVQVLEQASGRWEAADMDDAALFVGVNGSVCVSTREHPGISAGCVYFTEYEVGDACLRHAQEADNQRSSYDCEPDLTEFQETGVYSIKTGNVMKVVDEDDEHPSWPPPAWFTPSFL